MPDTSLLRLSRSKAVRRALPRVVSPHACRFFSSLINVAWFSFQPAYGAHKHTKKKKVLHKTQSTARARQREHWVTLQRCEDTNTCSLTHSIRWRVLQNVNTGQCRLMNLSVCGLSHCFLQRGQVPYCYSIKLNLWLTCRLTMGQARMGMRKWQKENKDRISCVRGHDFVSWWGPTVTKSIRISDMFVFVFAKVKESVRVQ